jgi:hypothetical protein
MSAISRALAVPRHRAEKKQAELSQVSRWGAPIWAAEEPDPRLERAAPDALPRETLLLAFLHSERG